MESNLQTLIERAWSLHDDFNNDIKNCNSFCRLCCERGRYCEVAGVPFKERESLTTMRDALKEVETRLKYLQSLHGWQQKDRLAALSRLQESRISLLEKIKQHQGRPLEILSDLNALFGGSIPDFDSNFKRTKRKNVQTKLDKHKKPITGFLIRRLRFLFNRWNWQKVFGFAVKFIVVSASMSSTIQFYHDRKNHGHSGKNSFLSMGPTGQQNNDSQRSISNRHLNVYYGMG